MAGDQSTNKPKWEQRPTTVPPEKKGGADPRKVEVRVPKPKTP